MLYLNPLTDQYCIGKFNGTVISGTLLLVVSRPFHENNTKNHLITGYRYKFHNGDGTTRRKILRSTSTTILLQYFPRNF